MTENEKETSIEKLKSKYKTLQEKYFLPTFEELNREFAIEKSDADSEFLLREIIHFIVDKFQNYLKFLENLINPANSSMFAFSLIKQINNGDRAKLSEIYKKISEVEIQLIKLDLKPNEMSEAQFIKNSYNLWKEIREDLFEIIEKAEKNFTETKNSEESKKGYFG